ncbi:MAG: hypothetical protein AAB757_00795, partial [Patescibacteria group bacterium]
MGNIQIASSTAGLIFGDNTTQTTAMTAASSSDWNAKQNAITIASSTTGTDFTISSSSATWTFNMPSASASNRGLLTSADWTTFNNKQAALILATSTSYGYNVFTISSSSPTWTFNIPQDWNDIAAMSTSTGNLMVASSTGWKTLSTSTNGYALMVSSTAPNFIAWTPLVQSLSAGTGISLNSATGNITVTNSQPHVTSTINGVTTNAFIFASSTTGTDFTISTTTNQITFNLPSASVSNRGLLTSTDWTTFNNKQSQLWGLNGSNLFASSTSWNVGIGTTAPSSTLHIVGSGITSQNTGGAGILRVNRTDGKIGAILAGGSFVGFYFDSSGDFAIQSTTRTTIEGTSFPAATDFVVKGSTGNVGIGTSTPAQKLSVVGNIQIASSTAGLIFGDNTTQTTAMTAASSSDWNAKQNAITIASSTTGTDFTISSSSATWTFNMPSASVSNRGLLTPTDWGTFNSKQAAITLATSTSYGYTAFTISSSSPTWTFNIPQDWNDIAAMSTSTGNLMVASSTGWKALGVGTNGKVLMASSTAPNGLSWETISSGGITSLNGLSGATQTFATSTNYGGFTITSSGSEHTFNFPGRINDINSVATTTGSLLVASSTWKGLAPGANGLC